jgi:hypothetical protein
MVSRRARLGVLMGFALLAGCETGPKLPAGARPIVEVEPPLKSDAWKKLATAADQNRLSRLDSAWQQALTEAGKSFSGEIRKEGVLLKPRSALPRPAPTPGSYNCRLIKLGQAVPRPAHSRASSPSSATSRSRATC